MPGLPVSPCPPTLTSAVHVGGSDTMEVPREALEEPTHLLAADVGVTHARTQARHGRSRLGTSAVGRR